MRSVDAVGGVTVFFVSLFETRKKLPLALQCRVMKAVFCYFFNFFIFYLFIPPPHGAAAPSGPGPPHYRGFTITLRHTALGRTPWTSYHPDAETSR
jgi:hypothetical protein